MTTSRGRYSWALHLGVAIGAMLLYLWEVLSEPAPAPIIRSSGLTSLPATSRSAGEGKGAGG